MFFCKHDWIVLTETVTKSKFESSVESISNSKAEGRVPIPHQLCCGDRKHMQVFTCTKCGELKRFVEQI